MNAHTPGPWRFFQHDAGTPYFGNVVGFYGPNKHGIEEVRTITVQLKYGSPDENAANARLISTAPELLEALNALLNDDCPNKQFVLGHPAAARARAAIAKATGAS